MSTTYEPPLASLTPAQARERKAKLAQLTADREEEILVVKNLMRTPAGRRWVWRILTFAKLYVAEAHNLDHAYLAFKEGLKAQALLILDPIRIHTPAEHLRMWEENTRLDLQLADNTQPTELDDD